MSYPKERNSRSFARRVRPLVIYERDWFTEGRIVLF